LPDDGFLRQISTILAVLKVVWRAKNISGVFPVSGGFLADLTISAQVYFVWQIWRNSGGFLVSFKKKQVFFQTPSCNFFFKNSY
jgi:hypothetical protein